MPPKRKRKRKSDDPHDELAVKVSRKPITLAELRKYNPIRGRPQTKDRVMSVLLKRAQAEAAKPSATNPVPRLSKTERELKLASHRKLIQEAIPELRQSTVAEDRELAARAQRNLEGTLRELNPIVKEIARARSPERVQMRMTRRASVEKGEVVPSTFSSPPDKTKRRSKAAEPSVERKTPVKKVALSEDNFDERFAQDLDEDANQAMIGIFKSAIDEKIANRKVTGLGDDLVQLLELLEKQAMKAGSKEEALHNLAQMYVDFQFAYKQNMDDKLDVLTNIDPLYGTPMEELEGEKSADSRDAFERRLKWTRKDEDGEISDDEPMTGRDKLRLEWKDNKARATGIDKKDLAAAIEAKQAESNKLSAEFDKVNKSKTKDKDTKLNALRTEWQRVGSELVELKTVKAFTNKTDDKIAVALQKLYTSNLKQFVDPKQIEDLELMFPTIANPDTRAGSLDPNAELGNQTPAMKPIEIGLITVPPAPPPQPLLPFAGDQP